jgi:hypothetical protein
MWSGLSRLAWTNDDTGAKSGSLAFRVSAPIVAIVLCMVSYKPLAFRQG